MRLGMSATQSHVFRPSRFLAAASILAFALLAAAWVSGTLPLGTATPLQVIGVCVVFATVSLGSRACLWAIVILAVLAPTATIGSLGSVQFRVWDPFYIGLVFWVATAPAPHHQTRWLRAIAVFLGFLGLTLLWVWHVDSQGFAVSAISWLRLVQTLSLAWLVPRCLRDERDVRHVLSLLLAIGVVAVALVATSSGQGFETALATGRHAYVFNINTFGLISALLVVSFLWQERRHLLVRASVAGVGMIGLVLSKSVASLIATVVASGLLVLWRNKGRLGVVKTLLSLAVLGAVAFSVLLIGRPEVLPSAPGFSTSSPAQRIVFAKAGIAEFVHHPVIGVGWQRSSDPEVIQGPDVLPWLGGSQAISLAFHTGVSPTVHNAYVQILAETGLIGSLLFLRVLWLGAQAIRPRLGSPLVAFIAAEISVVLVWWNDNGIFGSQTETLILGILLGALTVAAASSASPHPSSQITAPQQI
jgi:O-antigen ligase